MPDNFSHNVLCRCLSTSDDDFAQCELTIGVRPIDGDRVHAFECSIFVCVRFVCVFDLVSLRLFDALHLRPINTFFRRTDLGIFAETLTEHACVKHSTSVPYAEQ